MRRARTLPVLPLLMILATAACTGGGDGEVATADGGAPAGAVPAEDALARELEFIDCMRGQGVEMVDPIPGDTSGRSALRYEIDVNGKGSDPAFQAALDACAEHLPPVDRPEPDQEALDLRLAFAQCLRDNGVPDVPDPDPEGLPVFVGSAEGPVHTIVNLGGGYAVNPDDPVATAAVEQCRQFLPDPAIDIEGEQ
jgi:hypothetical protein